MTEKPERRLGAAEIEALSSPYIDYGVKQDSWKIEELRIEGERLAAAIRMTGFFVSPTDPGGFHLTIFTTQEFLGQLANIFVHVYAGHEKKCKEVWMREATVTYRKVIRDPENIAVEMRFTALKPVGDTLLVRLEARVSDPQGGLFTARMKGLMR